MQNEKVWFITGASKGLGLTLAKKLLEQGYRVAATSRTADSLVAEISETSASFLPLEMDLTSDADVKAAVEKAVAHFGRLDVVVNNAGYAQGGTLEELSYDEVKDSFEVNVFGVLNVIRNTAPYLREQGSGYFINITSIAGFSGGYPGFGLYCATKFAVAGLTETLAEEVKDFGIKTTAIYPGYFRTNFLSGGSLKTAKTPIAAYTAARASIDAHANEYDGNQPNDPERAVEIFIEISEMENPPVHLFLGKDAYGEAEKKIEVMQAALDENIELGTSTEIMAVK